MAAEILVEMKNGAVCFLIAEFIWGDIDKWGVRIKEGDISLRLRCCVVSQVA